MLLDSAIHSFDDARRIAKRPLPWKVFDCIDNAKGTEHGERLNRAIMRDLWQQSHILNNAEHHNFATTLFSNETKMPFGIAPKGVCNLVSPCSDRLLATFATMNQVPVCVSTVASTSLEDMIVLAEGNAWLQLDVSYAIEELERLLHRAEMVGYETLVLTVDVSEVGRRPLREGAQAFTDLKSGSVKRPKIILKP